MKKRHQAFWFGFLVTVLLSGCQTTVKTSGPTSGQASGSRNDRIVLGTTATLNSIDPADATSSFAGLLLYNLGDRLYTYKLGTQEIVPQLAAAMPQVSADGLSYKIALRSGVKFHDGEAFDGAAMAFSLNRLLKNGGAAGELFSSIEAVTATGPMEVTIKLKEAFTAFPALLTHPSTSAVSPKAYEIKEKSFKPKEFVGTGPYKLVSYGTDLIKLEAFNEYWQGNPANPGVDVQLISSGANLYNGFRTGSIDLAVQGLAIEQIRNLQEQSKTQGWEMIEKPGSSIDFLVFNLQSPPLDKLEVRQAIAATLDRSLLQTRVFDGQVEPLLSLLPTNMPSTLPVFEAKPDFEKAKMLLKTAGYSVEKPLKLELWYRSNLTNDQLAALTMKAVADRSLGGLLKFELNSVESASAYNNLDKGVYPLFILDWSADYFDPDTYLYPLLQCDKGDAVKGCEKGQTSGWGSFYFSDVANRLISESRKEGDAKKRSLLLEKIQKLSATDLPYLPLWQNKDYLFVQKGLTGASLEVTQKVPFWTIRKTQK
jgi:peptide/nickel transport system substrate-binding protein